MASRSTAAHEHAPARAHAHAKPLDAAADRTPGVRPFRKRTYRLGGLVADALGLVPRTADLVAIYARKRMDPRVREAIMVAVAQANACRYCSYVHGAWAAWLGLRAIELAQLRGEPLDVLEARLRWAAEHAVRSVAAEADSPAETTDAEHDALGATFSPEERVDIETVARMMTLANRVGNTFDALLARRGGGADPGGRLLDELAVSALFLAAVPPVVAGLAALRRQSPWEILQEFRTFSAAFESSPG